MIKCIKGQSGESFRLTGHQVDPAGVLIMSYTAKSQIKASVYFLFLNFSKTYLIRSNMGHIHLRSRRKRVLFQDIERKIMPVKSKIIFQ